MRSHEEFHVEALLQWLQPIPDQTGAGVRLAGGKGLDQGLTAGTLIKQLDVEIVLGIDSLGHAEPERRVARRNLGPGQAHLGGWSRDRWRVDVACQNAGGCGETGGTGGLEQRTAGNAPARYRSVH